MDSTRLKYLPLFVTEARKQLAATLEGLARMERGERGEVVHTTFREIHTLKGASGSLSFTSIFNLSHHAEELLEEYRKGTLRPDDDGLRLLRRCVERLEDMVAEAAAGEESVDAVDLQRAVIEHLRVARNSDFRMVDGNTRPELPEETAPARREVDSLGSIAELMAVAQQLRAWSAADPRLAAESARLEVATRRIYSRLASLRQENFTLVATTLRRQLHQVCTRQDRQAILEVRGEDVLVDPDVLAALQGPLVQLINNAVVHGIEPAEERTRRGKPVTGRVELDIERVGEELILTLRDDGGGINAKKVRTADERLTDLEATETPGRAAAREPRRAPSGLIREQIFRPGLTTLITPHMDGGRGEGLAAVRHAVEALGGRISVESREGRGTQFRIVVPVTQRFEELLLVEDSGRTRALPARSLRAKHTARTVETREGGARRVDRVLGTVEGLVCTPPFPFNLLPQVNGTTVGPDGTILFVVDPLSFPAAGVPA